MTNREVWILAGEIMSTCEKGAADYIIERRSDALDDRVAVEDWRRVAAAVDAINDTTAQ
jgi:hypothetical protein